MPTLLGLTLASINPISLMNWVVGLIIYFSYIRKNKSDKFRWPKGIAIYLAVLFPFYFIMCLIVGMIPPETPITFLLKLVIGSLCNA